MQNWVNDHEDILVSGAAHFTDTEYVHVETIPWFIQWKFALNFNWNGETMSRASSTNLTASADIVDIGAHARPVVLVVHVQNHLTKAEMSAPFATMVQIE